MASAVDLRDEMERHAPGSKRGRGRGDPVHRGAPLRRYEPGKGPGLLLRGDRRGDHQRPLPRPGTARGVADGFLPVLRHRPSSHGDRTPPPCRHGPRRERSQVRQPAPDHGPAGGRGPRVTISGRSRSTARCRTSSRFRRRSPGTSSALSRSRSPPRRRGRCEQSPTRHVQAYDYYLRGRSFYYQYGRNDIEFALQLFSRATELDPGIRPGLRGARRLLVVYLSLLGAQGFRPPPGRSREPPGRRAGPRLRPGPGILRPGACRLGGKRKKRSAASRPPSSSTRSSSRPGTFTPATPSSAGTSRRPPAITRRRVACVRTTTSPRCSSPRSTTTSAGRKKGGPPRRRGVALVAERLELHPDDARALYMGANGLVALGESETKASNGPGGRGPSRRNEPMLLYNLGCIYSLAGEIDEALDCLERAVAHGLTQKGVVRARQQPRPLSIRIRASRRF